jgi:hypothetical protein
VIDDSSLNTPCYKPQKCNSTHNSMFSIDERVLSGQLIWRTFPQNAISNRPHSALWWQVERVQNATSFKIIGAVCDRRYATFVGSNMITNLQREACTVDGQPELLAEEQFLILNYPRNEEIRNIRCIKKTAVSMQLTTQVITCFEWSTMSVNRPLMFSHWAVSYKMELLDRLKRPYLTCGWTTKQLVT